MGDDIVARLRALCCCAPIDQFHGLCDACVAANRLEGLYEDTERLRDEINRLRAVFSDIDALACNVHRPDEAVDYWVTGYADAMQKVKALLHPEEARRG